MEYIRDITLTLEVDTNKRTITKKRSLESVGDVMFEAENLMEEMREALD